MIGTRVLRFLSLGLMGVVLAACATTTPQVSGNLGTVDVSYEAVGLINSFRAQNGLAPVSVDPALIETARYQAVAMASRDVLSHEVAGDFTSRMNNAGFVYANATENVGAGHTSTQDAINAWIRSPHHRENMLMRDATRIGMVKANAPNSRYRSYWALDITSAAAGSAPKVAVVGAQSGKSKNSNAADGGGISFLFNHN